MECLNTQIAHDRAKRDLILKDKEKREKESELEKRRLLSEIENLVADQDVIKLQIDDEEKCKDNEIEKLQNWKKEIEENLKKEKEQLDNAVANSSEELVHRNAVEKLQNDQEDLRKKIELEQKQRNLGLKILRNELEFAIRQEQEKEKLAKDGRRKEKELQRKKELKRQQKQMKKAIDEGINQETEKLEAKIAEIEKSQRSNDKAEIETFKKAVGRTTK